MAATLTLDRTQYRALVAEVAARAKAILPQAVNGRIESAVKLVLAYDVMPQPDGSILVGSSSDAMQSYLLVGQACECQDFTRGQAPEGWCQHRIAAGIAKRVGELLPQSPDVEQGPDNDAEDPEPQSPPVETTAVPSQPAPVPEMPFSVTLKGTIDGQDALLTARGMTAEAFKANLEAIRGLLDAPTSRQAEADDTPQCPEHGAMTPSTKGKGWFCPTKLSDDTWYKSRGK